MLGLPVPKEAVACTDLGTALRRSFVLHWPFVGFVSNQVARRRPLPPPRAPDNPCLDFL